MSKRRVSLKENPDQPHAFQPRKVTRDGEPLVPWWDEFRRGDSQFEPPCRYCGGSKTLPVHWLESRRPPPFPGLHRGDA